MFFSSKDLVLKLISGFNTVLRALDLIQMEREAVRRVYAELDYRNGKSKITIIYGNGIPYIVPDAFILPFSQNAITFHPKN